MCYAIPGRIVKIEGKIATVDYYGEYRRALNEFCEVKPGDYVYAQGGIIIEKVEKDAAEQILFEWKDKFRELKDIDIKRSEISGYNLVSKEFIKIINKVKGKEELSKEELLILLRTSNKHELNLLYEAANNARRIALDNACCVHGIIEFSNQCSKNCKYCGIRKDNKGLKRYRLSINEIASIAEHAVNRLGFKALVLQSGEDYSYSTEELVQIIKEIRKRCSALIMMSVGTRDLECYRQMYNAGARGVLLRFETSNKELYEQNHDSSFEERIDRLEQLNKLGYIIATGGLIGLPGQTEEDLLNDILLAKKLNAEMWSLGPVIPHKDTPLKDLEKVEINKVLKVLAVSRFVQPDAKILITTALETLDRKNGRTFGLSAGGNSLMINITPDKYKELYNIYPGKNTDKSVEEEIKETVELLFSLGRAPTDLGR